MTLINQPQLNLDSLQQSGGGSFLWEEAQHFSGEYTIENLQLTGAPDVPSTANTIQDTHITPVLPQSGSKSWTSVPNLTTPLAVTGDGFALGLVNDQFFDYWTTESQSNKIALLKQYIHVNPDPLKTTEGMALHFYPYIGLKGSNLLPSELDSNAGLLLFPNGYWEKNEPSYGLGGNVNDDFGGNPGGTLTAAGIQVAYPVDSTFTGKITFTYGYTMVPQA